MNTWSEITPSSFGEFLTQHNSFQCSRTVTLWQDLQIYLQYNVRVHKYDIEKRKQKKKKAIHVSDVHEAVQIRK